MAKNKSGGKGGVAALERSPSHLLHRALQRALDIYAEEFGEAGITQRQFAVLAAADERAGATQADLVRITGIDRSTLADMARRMIGNAEAIAAPLVGCDQEDVEHLSAQRPKISSAGS